LIALAAGCAIDRTDLGDRPELKGSFGGSGATNSGVTTASGAGGSVTASSSSVTASSSASSSTSGGGGGGSGGSANCVDFGEPNDSEMTAHDLGTIDDCDKNGATITAALHSPQDIDWFRYTATDAFGCFVDPHRALKSSGALRLCKFAECVVGKTDVSCKNSATPTTSPAGRAGCCHGLSFGMDVECEGLADDAFMYIRLDQGPAPCASYSLDYHY
jgi:hypothetical protein